MSRLILASKSARRFELLSMTGRSFEVKDAHVDEDAIVNRILHDSASTDDGLTDQDCPPMYLTAKRICCALAEAKAQAVLEQECGSDVVVLGSDTIVVTEDEILGKPADEADARRMLQKLSGKTHRVYTGVSILSRENRNIFSCHADVRFHDMDATQSELIEDYIATGSPMDKAGAYGIQDQGSLLIDSIEGDYYAVVGLPVSRVNRELIHFEL